MTAYRTLLGVRRIVPDELAHMHATPAAKKAIKK